MSDAAGTWWLDEAGARLVARRAGGERRRSGLRAAARRGLRRGRALTPAVADALGLPRESSSRRAAATRRSARSGSARRGRATPSFRSAPRRKSSSPPTATAPRRKSSSTVSPMRCRSAGIAWRRCSTAPARSPSSRASSAPTPARSSARRRSDYRGPGETIFLPYLSGERTPHDDPHARGVIFGLGEAATRVDLTRAAMEGVAFTLADARDCLAATGDAPRRLRPDRRRREERAVDADDRRGGRRADHAPPGRRSRAGVRRGAAGASRGDRRGAGDDLHSPADRRRRPSPTRRSSTPSPPRASVSPASIAR